MKFPGKLNFKIVCEMLNGFFQKGLNQIVFFSNKIFTDPRVEKRGIIMLLIPVVKNI
jgi:hypothetical protein